MQGTRRIITNGKETSERIFRRGDGMHLWKATMDAVERRIIARKKLFLNLAVPCETIAMNFLQFFRNTA